MGRMKELFMEQQQEKINEATPCVYNTYLLHIKNSATVNVGAFADRDTARKKAARYKEVHDMPFAEWTVIIQPEYI